MATIRTTNVRLVPKNGLEENWNKVTDYVPLLGEPIIYLPDAMHNFNRIKVGNGVDLPKDLPFVPFGSIPGFDPKNITAQRVEHKLTFGVDGEYKFDGSEDVNVPVYDGSYDHA